MSATSTARQEREWGETLNLNPEVCLMERREFLKVALGFTAAAGAIAATAMSAQAAPMLPDASAAKPPEGAARTAAQGKAEPAANGEHNAVKVGDTDISSHRRRRYWRRRRRVWYRRPRRWWRRRRRVIYY
jgi:hypothetical protein